MEEILAKISISHLALIPAFIYLILFFRALFSKGNSYFLKPFLFLLVFFALFIFLNEQDYGRQTLLELKEKHFPSKVLSLNYTVNEHSSKGVYRKVYVFQDPKPKITLVPMESGKYFMMKNVDTINAVLNELNLPPVKEGVPDLSTVTGSNLDTAKFRWENYRGGTLTVIKELCRDKDSLTFYDCISSIIVENIY